MSALVQQSGSTSSMLKNKTLVTLFVVCGFSFLLSGCVQLASKQSQDADSGSIEIDATISSLLADRDIVPIQIGDTQLEVEVVSSPASISQGLSGRDEIGSDGMLFVLPTRRNATFWMIDMKFDLDMVWIDRYEVVSVTANVPAPSPGTSSLALPTYSPGQPVEMVLELPAGQAAELGVDRGDRLKIML